MILAISPGFVSIFSEQPASMVIDFAFGREILKNVAAIGVNNSPFSSFKLTVNSRPDLKKTQK